MNIPLRCVIDTNINIKQFIPDPFTPKVEQLFAHLNDPLTQFFFPDLFYIESANTLWKYVRAGLYNADDVQADLASLKELPLIVISTADLMADAVNIALNYNISAYDACYVALSQQVQAPLLTLDEKLVRILTNTSYQAISFKSFTVPPYSFL